MPRIGIITGRIDGHRINIIPHDDTYEVQVWSAADGDEVTEGTTLSVPNEADLVVNGQSITVEDETVLERPDEQTILVDVEEDYVDILL